ncbi:MAG: metallophosphoesterase [Clostridiales bacterium]|nr:metallophosphoesterase [Clostridiales bacterium]
MKSKTRARLTKALAVTMALGLTIGCTQVYARSSTRAAWNDASSSKDTSTTLYNTHSVETDEDGNQTTVYSNVYADSDKWAAWKTLWASEISTDYEQVALTPGTDETQLNFGWYSMTKETPSVKLYDADKKLIGIFTGTQDVDNAETFTENEASITLYPNKVTVTGLTEETTYYYSYLVDGNYSELYEYTTESFEEFSVMYVGDPQIGASTGQDTATATSSENGKEYYAMNDAYNWNETLTNAVEKFPNLAFILSAGDQINQTSVSDNASQVQQQKEYAGFLYSSVLRSLPIATTIGNHDSKSVNYSNHFNNPNTQEEGTSGATGASTAGTDYYFNYGTALFIVIDTNNYNAATHEAVMKEAIEAYPDATWRLVMFHQDIYGSGYDHSDSDGMVLRTQLTPLMDEYDIDAVLQGHDHTYSRTYQISSTTTSAAAKVYSTYDTDADSDFQKDCASCYNILSGTESINYIIDPEGTVYFEANSSTGSKFYQMIATQQDYIAARSQSWRPTYQIIDFTETTLTVTTYDAATGEVLVADDGIDSTYTIVKSADKTSLTTQITSATESYNAAVTAGTYTESSLKTLSDTITAAQAIYDDAEATTTDIASAITSLQSAVSGLELAAVETERENSENSNSENTENADSENSESIDSEDSESSESESSEDADSEDADSEDTDSEDADSDEDEGSDEEVIDMETLEEQLSSAIEAYDAAVEAGNYTAESLATLAEAIEAAQAVIDDPDATDEEIANAYEALQDAIDALEEDIDEEEEEDTNVDSNDGTNSVSSDGGTSVTSSSPKTGDASFLLMLLGFAAAGFSACGMALLRMKKSCR